MAEEEVDEAPAAGYYGEALPAGDGFNRHFYHPVDRHHPEEAVAFGHAGVDEAGPYFGDGNRCPL